MKIPQSCILAITVSTGIFLFSCGNKKDDPVPVQSDDATVVKNIAADSTGTGHYTFFSFAKNDTIPLNDSATTHWDIGFKSTTIIINGGTSGPGGGGAQIVVGLFDEITEAPASGYKTDQGSSFAISTGSGNGWYNYNSTTHIVTPIPGRVLVFRTADGKYAKVEMLSYYKNMPSNPQITDVPRFYSFRYIYQPDGSRNLQ